MSFLFIRFLFTKGCTEQCYALFIRSGHSDPVKDTMHVHLFVILQICQKLWSDQKVPKMA